MSRRYLASAMTLSLADDAIALAEEYLRVPSGVKAGEPLVLTPEQIEFLIEWYRVTPDGRSFVWQRGCWSALDVYEIEVPS